MLVSHLQAMKEWLSACPCCSTYDFYFHIHMRILSYTSRSWSGKCCVLSASLHVPHHHTLVWLWGMRYGADNNSWILKDGCHKYIKTNFFQFLMPCGDAEDAFNSMNKLRLFSLKNENFSNIRKWSWKGTKNIANVKYSFLLFMRPLWRSKGMSGKFHLQQWCVSPLCVWFACAHMRLHH